MFQKFRYNSHGSCNTPAQGELIFSKKGVAQRGSIKERTKTWIPGFQLHIETKQQQQTKGAGLASALNQGQMSCRGDGWQRGEAGNGALAASRANRSPAQLYTEKGTPRYVGLRRGLNFLSPFFFHLHKLFWCSSPWTMPHIETLILPRHEKERAPSAERGSSGLDLNPVRNAG